MYNLYMWPCRCGQDHVRIILLQNWAVALNAWSTILSNQEEIFHGFWFESIELNHVRLLNTRSPSLPGDSASFFSQWFLQLDRLYSVQKTHGKLIWCYVGRLSYSNHFTTAEHGWSRQSELHAITAGLNGGCSAHKTNYCYSVFIHRTDLFIDVITRQLRLVLCINDYVRSSTIDSSIIFALQITYSRSHKQL